MKPSGRDALAYVVGMPWQTALLTACFEIGDTNAVDALALMRELLREPGEPALESVFSLGGYLGIRSLVIDRYILLAIARPPAP